MIQVESARLSPLYIVSFRISNSLDPESSPMESTVELSDALDESYKATDSDSLVISKIGNENDLESDVLDAFCVRLASCSKISGLFILTPIANHADSLSLARHFSSYLSKSTKNLVFILNTNTFLARSSSRFRPIEEQ